MSAKRVFWLFLSDLFFSSSSVIMTSKCKGWSWKQRKGNESEGYKGSAEVSHKLESVSLKNESTLTLVRVTVDPFFTNRTAFDINIHIEIRREEEEARAGVSRTQGYLKIFPTDIIQVIKDVCINYGNSKFQQWYYWSNDQWYNICVFQGSTWMIIKLKNRTPRNNFDWVCWIAKFE